MFDETIKQVYEFLKVAYKLIYKPQRKDGFPLSLIESGRVRRLLIYRLKSYLFFLGDGWLHPAIPFSHLRLRMCLGYRLGAYKGKVPGMELWWLTKDVFRAYCYSAFQLFFAYWGIGFPVMSARFPLLSLETNPGSFQSPCNLSGCLSLCMKIFILFE